MILRLLWRRRLLTACAAALSLLPGLATVYHVGWPLESRQYEVGLATASILVDTPRSQVVDIAPTGSDTLGVRANLLAKLMLDGELKAAIARRAALRPEQLAAEGENGIGPTPTSIGRYDHVLRTSVLLNTDGGQLPIISIEAQAPGPGGAAAIADAAVASLTGYLDARAQRDGVRDDRRLRVSLLGPPEARTVSRGPRKLYGLAVALLVFGAACAAIVGATGLARAWRETATEDVTDDVAAATSA